MHWDPTRWPDPEHQVSDDESWLHDRIGFLIGIPLGLLLGLAVAFFLIIGSGRDTPTISTTSSPPKSSGAKPGAPPTREVRP